VCQWLGAGRLYRKWSVCQWLGACRLKDGWWWLEDSVSVCVVTEFMAWMNCIGGCHVVDLLSVCSTDDNISSRFFMDLAEAVLSQCCVRWSCDCWQHNSHVMALCLSATEADVIHHQHQQQQQMAHIARARQAAEWMSSRQDGISSHHLSLPMTHTDRRTYTDGQTHRQTTHTQTDSQTQTDRHTDRPHTHRQTQTDRHRRTDTQTDHTHTQTDGQTDR